jgi:hypothetical protein
MNNQLIANKLSEKAPTGYRLNDLIEFSYPVRRITLELLVNKQPDGSLLKVYSVLLRAIQAGFQTKQKLFDFLGLGETDEFILRELFALREKNYLNLVSQTWILTEAGEQFIKDNSILRVEEHEEFEFLIDGISGDIISSKKFRTVREKEKLGKALMSELTLPIKSPELLENKYEALSDLYKYENESRSYLISYSVDEIKKDYEEWLNCWLVEYIPESKSHQEARLEVRNYHDDLKLNKELTAKFNADYSRYINTLSNIERNDLEIIIQDHKEPLSEETKTVSPGTLTIWQTKEKFIEALKSVKDKILIESPWIKRATLDYIPLFENILKEKKKLVILYGISEKDEHDFPSLKKLEELYWEYQENFVLVHLPTHFSSFRTKLTGTHRKLVIKDNDFYLSGSFNFLSFGKNENQRVANEESFLITGKVQEKWEEVSRDYSIKLF